ncbi:MAG TPA: hypothetical protein PLK55_04375 [archaeon]|jgi:Txe/YoeB family toxin of Txe-Axe toxin-antitoxin module|nr:hypothetical protein [archaeon]
MKSKKIISVYYSREFNEEYLAIKAVVDMEVKKGLLNSQNHQLLTKIDRTIEILKSDPDYGVSIAKDIIPKELIKEYNINNLRKVNLSNYWRLCYTIKTDSVEIVSIVLKVMDHKKYNKLFGYK